MGKGKVLFESKMAQLFMTCLLLAGVAATASFNCYDCASLLSLNSRCETGPDNTTSTTCRTFCYTDVLTQAGVRSFMKRGCTTELECTEGSTCRELSRTGSCRSCCQSELCNADYPDDLSYKSTWVPSDLKNSAANTLARITLVAFSCLASWV
ncbi:uncharacterized protein [Asterias amurensis]|uniref:uncharacterized protein n=1 Tax=Asterias amurensis TaxID=7602 RepID=UPI003AB5AEA9